MDSMNENMSGVANTPDASSGAHIVDVTTESFMADVIEASQSQLVLLDLWAPWCEPCKQLTPVLEKLVGLSNGTVRLAKMNIDEHPAVAQQLKVQSIPAVFAFKAGRPVDGFMGALPESELKAFIDKHADGPLGPTPVESLIEAAAHAMAEDNIDGAGRAYAEILSMEPTHLPAIAGLAHCHLALGNHEAAAQTLEMAPATSNNPDILAARAAVALAEKAQDAGDDGPLLAAIEANPEDYQARYDLALVYHAAGRREEAMDALLDIVARKRDWNEEAARKQLLEFFDAYGADDELVVAGRRKLSSVLFS